MRLWRVVKQMKTLNSELTSAQIGDTLLPPKREWSNRKIEFSEEE